MKGGVSDSKYKGSVVPDGTEPRCMKRCEEVECTKEEPPSSKQGILDWPRVSL